MELLNKKDLGELVNGDTTDVFRKAHVHEPCLAIGHCCFHANMMVNFVGLLHRFVGEVALRVFACALDHEFLIISKTKIHYGPFFLRNNGRLVPIEQMLVSRFQ